MSFECACFILLLGVPLITALLVFGIPYLRNNKEQHGSRRTARFKSPRLENKYKFRYHK